MLPASRRGVLGDLAVGAGVGVLLGRVRWVVGVPGVRRLALVCQAERHEVVALLALVRPGLRGKHKDD